MLTPIEQITELLSQWERAPKMSQRIANRCRIILCAQKRRHFELAAQELSCEWKTVKKLMAAPWMTRWDEAIPNVLEYWNTDGFDRKAAVLAILQDKPRSGRKSTFSRKQVTQTIACQPPTDFDRPITHWTNRELADEVVKQGIVPRISCGSVGRFLNMHSLKPHKSQ